MDDIDKRIDELGFDLIEDDKNINSLTYHNEDADHEIIIQYSDDENECCIYSNSISTSYDDFGHPYNESMGTTLEETKVFTEKLVMIIDERIK